MLRSHYISTWGLMGVQIKMKQKISNREISCREDEGKKKGVQYLQHPDNDN
jgi:hypothetical protein